MTSILSVSAYTGFAVRPVRHMNLMRVCWHDISYRSSVVLFIFHHLIADEITCSKCD